MSTAWPIMGEWASSIGRVGNAPGHSRDCCEGGGWMVRDCPHQINTFPLARWGSVGVEGGAGE